MLCMRKEPWCIVRYPSIYYLLPTGSEERGALGVGSIPVVVHPPPRVNDVRNVALTLHKHEYSWIVEIRNTSEAVPGAKYTPWSLL